MRRASGAFNVVTGRFQNLIMMKSSSIVLAVLILSLFMPSGVFAQNRYEEYTNVRNGAQTPLTVGDTLSVLDTVFVTPSLKPAIVAVNEISNVVTLSLNEFSAFSTTQLPDSFSISVNAQVRVYSTNWNSYNTTSRVFTVTYSKNHPYHKIDVFQFNGGRRVRVEVLSISAYNLDVNVARSFLLLSNDLRIDRDYSMANPVCTLSGFSSYLTSIADGRDTLRVSWPASKCAELYDLEWTYVSKEAYNQNRYGTFGTAAFAANVFRNNATRVTIPGLSYNIPLLFNDEGYVFFRYRAVQHLANGNRVTSNWSHVDNLSTGLGRTLYTGHQTGINWQASTGFSEEGKLKSVVHYFDGTMKQRQSVTKDNITTSTVISETMYDHQGRPVISVLPAPTQAKVIQFTPLINRALNAPGSEYSKDLYDGLNSVSAYCNTAAPGISKDTGASKYYSPDNPLGAAGFNRFIPDAELFPFTETKYTQDNTGRIAAQSGVGKDFRLGSNHETKYYYGTPSQADLDALFGTDAGYASHYQKNMVRDANGQYSVSYVDMKGRTVATALAGIPPSDKVTALSSYETNTRTESLLTAENNAPKGNSIVFSKTIMVPRGGSYQFTYSLSPQTLQIANWQNQQICYDCLYDLTITISDECGNQTMPNGVPYIHKKSNFSLNSINSNCSDPTRAIQETFSVTLPEGSYVITKELSMSEAGAKYYKDNVFLPNNHKTTFEEILAQQKLLVKTQLGDCLTNGDNPPSTGEQDVYASLMVAQMREGGIYSDRYRSLIALYSRLGFSKQMLDQLLVILHPEYQVYQLYASLDSSNKWDKRMRALGTYQDAVQQGFLNPLSMTTQPAVRFSAVEPDPFFADNPTFKTRMIDSVNRAFVTSVTFSQGVPVPATFLNMWAMSNIMVKCGVTNNVVDPVCVDVFANNNKVFSSSVFCEAEMNDAWNNFKTMYLGKKSMLTAVYLKSVGYPAVADPKQRVFPDPLESLNFANLGVDPFSGNAQAIVQQGKDVVTKMVDDNCRGYAQYWWSLLSNSGCGFDKNRDSAIIINRLIQVCKEGGDETHPFGASTVKPTSSSTFRSFHDAIADYITNTPGISGNVTLCNGLIIDAPGPYARPFIAVEKKVTSKPDECECTNLKALKKVYTERYTSTYATMSLFLKQVYQTEISQGAIDTLTALCNDQLDCVTFTKPVVLPTVFQCGNVRSVCVDCETVKTAHNAYLSSYPSQVPSANQDTSARSRFYGLYMDQKTGLVKTATEYLSFITTCDNTPGSYAGTVTVLPDPPKGNCVSDVLVFPGTGVAKPSGINCNDLKRIYEDFIAEFPGRRNGATVRMLKSEGGVAAMSAPQENVNSFSTSSSSENGKSMQLTGPSYDTIPQVPQQMSMSLMSSSSSSSMVWVDSTMTAEQLFSWYMSEHLQLSGGAYDHRHYADWLINSCGYKMYQLPWADTVAVRQDTLMNVWNRYLAKYPGTQTTLSETVSIAFRKGVRVQSDATADYYNEDKIIASTWTNGDWYTYRHSSVYNLAILPKNASISSASLNLYADKYSWFFAPHFRNINSYPYMQIQPVRGQLIPGKTSYSLAPQQHSAISVVNLPYTSTNRISSGNNSDFYSNQNYLSVNVYGLISSMYSQLSSTGINYPVVYRLNDESNSYKMYQFGGAANTDVSKRPTLNVTYTASRCDVFTAFVNNALGASLSTAEVKNLFATKGAMLIDASCLTATPGPGCQTSGNTSRAFLQLSGVNYSDNKPVPTIRDNFTIEFWARPSTTHQIDAQSATGTGGTSGQRYVVGPAHVTGPTINAVDPSFSVSNTAAGIGVSMGTNGISVYEHSDAHMPATLAWSGTVTSWTHVAVVYTNKLPRLYVNGQLVLTGSTSQRFTVVPSYSFFGFQYGSMPGHLTEMRIWNTSRTQAQIQANMNKTMTAGTAGLVHYWPMSEGVGMLQNKGSSGTGMNLANNTTWAWATGTPPPADSSSAVKAFASNLLLCGDLTKPTFQPLPADVLPTACKDSTAMAWASAQEIYRHKLDSTLGRFDALYKAKCLNAGGFESLVMEHQTSEYHYTLYYYDQAGNLVKTVPPAGVDLRRDASFLSDVATKRAANQRHVPTHTKFTVYRYNSLNAVVSQYTPDGGQSNFWYDKLGRLSISRNAEQAKTNLYSYTTYDLLGRINEVGEKQQPNAMTDVVARNTTTLGNWLNFTNSTYPHKQVNRTVYDVASTINQVYDKFRQHAYTLRNRVSYVQYFDQLQYSNNAPTYLNYNQATYYNYDIHGNVDTLLHDYATGAMAGQGFNRFKVVAYAYDLISGKVNLVTYQPGLMDALYHRYAYDAENRLTDVYTTTRRALVGNRTVEERDAAYSYYRHGPLARTEVGNHRVQGLDYAYTLQGWLKGMNSVAQTPTADQGQDGVSGSPGSTVRDAFGFSLNYFAGDYKPINPTVVPFPAANAYITTGYKPLFNGNISHMQVAIRGMKTLLYNYGYDQLNRLSSMRAFQGYDSLANTWSGLTSAGKYSEDITYDANGNIVTYNRDGDKTSTSLPMDRLTYYYKSGKNQLDYVQDNVGAAVYTEDIDGQTAGNYQYDAIGNLISDQKEGLTAIEWTVYGKIRKITKSTGQVISYTYDVSGNRISKAVTTGGNVETTWYVRDAQGNTLATYRINSGGITLAEQYLFGSSRLGAINRNLPLTSSLTVTSSTIPGIGVVYPSIVRHGEKQYELANHLGNVLAVVSDRRKPIFTGGSLSHYEPDLVSSTDYYPFGMAMPGRSLNAGGYRYGFNGQEKSDDVVKGNYTAEYWEYDPRVARRWNLDPRPNLSFSPYSVFASNPVLNSDPKGDTIIVNNRGFISRNDNTDKLVFAMKKGKLTQIGELGKTIDINGIYENIVADNAKKAKIVYNPFTFRELVKTKGDWDLKNNKETIYGLANDGKTQFLFQGQNMESQDVGNHHFGVVAKAYGLFTESFILKHAGAYQIKSGTSKPEWQVHKKVKVPVMLNGGKQVIIEQNVVLPPYGDDPRDRRWIQSGFEYYKQHRSSYFNN